MKHVLGLLVLNISVVVAAETVPLPRAHAHNDYEHTRPLAEALERGFCSVEADVYLVAGQLLVAHDRKDVKRERTLASLYLDPLRERVRQNGGWVYADAVSVVLLVDVKSEATPTYAALHVLLARYAEMVTKFRDGRREPGAVTVIVSGNRAQKEMAAQTLRYAAVDGRDADLAANPPATLVPLVSENWQKLFQWRWEGVIPAGENAALREWVARAHAQGRRVRFWNTPDRPAAWRVLLEAGVDVIGADDLAGLQTFLLTAGR